MHLAIIGTGKMGTGIFQWAVDRDIELTLCSRSEENLRDQERRFLRKLDRTLRRGDITAEKADAKKALVHFTRNIAEIARADFALETVPEDIEIKTATLRAMEDVLSPNEILLSNTSSISLEKLAGALKHPDRFCGLHFFHPVMVVSLVEIIRWRGLSSGVVDRVRELCRVLGRKGLVVADSPGSPLNWILGCLYVEAMYLLEEGAALPSRLDQAARHYISPGPCEAMDTLGMDLISKIAAMFTVGPDKQGTIWLDKDAVELAPENAGGREGFHIPWLLDKLLRENRLGRKTSRGLFVYEGDSTLDDDPAYYPCPGSSVNPLPDDEIADRIFYSLYISALFAVTRELCGTEDIDFGLREVLLMEKGPLRLAKERGAEKVRSDLERLESKWGKRFHPPIQPEEIRFS